MGRWRPTKWTATAPFRWPHRAGPCIDAPAAQSPASFDRGFLARAAAAKHRPGPFLGWRDDIHTRHQRTGYCLLPISMKPESHPGDGAAASNLRAYKLILPDCLSRRPAPATRARRSVLTCREIVRADGYLIRKIPVNAVKKMLQFREHIQKPSSFENYGDNLMLIWNPGYKFSRGKAHANL